jgi:sec-independent protein translocase protein TatC
MKEMTLVEHLEELRKRAIYILIILVGGFAACYSFGDLIAEFLMVPLRDALGTREKWFF